MPKDDRLWPSARRQTDRWEGLHCMRACEGAHGGARMGLEQEAEGLVAPAFSHLASDPASRNRQRAVGRMAPCICSVCGHWGRQGCPPSMVRASTLLSKAVWPGPQDRGEKLCRAGAGPGRRRQKETCVPKWDEVASRGECEGRLFCSVPVDSRSRPRELHDRTECPITSAPGAQDGSPCGCPCLSVPVCCQTASL